MNIRDKLRTENFTPHQTCSGMGPGAGTKPTFGGKSEIQNPKY